jgi:hypothetical protein
MKMKMNRPCSNIAKVLGVVSLVLSASAAANEFELSGKVGTELRYFFDDAIYPKQMKQSQASVMLETEFYWGWNNGSDSVIFKPFYRQDNQDDERSHGDIRELSYVHASDDWELRAGIRKEYWGVTEFGHLVDVINQTDTVEDTDGEDKLGQLMLNLSVVNDWGIVDVFLLPGFRQRTFTSEEGRLRGVLTVDKHHVSYQSGAKDQHLDFALRWTHNLGDFDIGSYWFHGTNREPVLSLAQDGERLVLRQYYNQMDQLGLDVQATLGDWLYKFETIFRSTQEQDFWATQFGFEYTYVGIVDSSADLGLLMEHSWDSRGEGELSSPGASLQNDLFLGARVAFNDMQSSEVLIGMGSDLEHNAYTFIVEASRRFGDSVKATLDVRLLQSNDPIDQLFSVKQDDHLQFSLEWYY